jgi:protein involved in polysaccharide export with SLBB domain
MKGRKFYHLFYVLLCIVFMQSAVSAQTPIPTPETIAANTSPETLRSEANLIHLGDLIDVDVIGSVEYDWRGTPNPEGFLDGIDFIENPIFALCRSEDEIATEVAKAYGKILRDPKVVVRILDRSNRPLSFLYGAVKTPQRFQIKRPIFLNEMLVLSGGLTEKASGEIQIFRPKSLSCIQRFNKESNNNAGDGEVREKFVTASQDNGSSYLNIRISDLLKGKKEANPQIFSGDVVTVLEAESIYVIGGVTNPKQISARSQITLSRAVSSAGGVTKKADSKAVIIYRREAGETKIIEADLEKIKKGEADDPVLRAFDIVEVTQSGREKSKFTPVLKIAESGERKMLNLPLRIID